MSTKQGVNLAPRLTFSDVKEAVKLHLELMSGDVAGAKLHYLDENLFALCKELNSISCLQTNLSRSFIWKQLSFLTVDEEVFDLLL